MKYTLKTLSAGLLAVVAFSVAAQAQVQSDGGEAANAFLSAQVAREALQAQERQQPLSVVAEPLKKYQAKLLEIKLPEKNPEAILDALRELTEYNLVFATGIHNYQNSKSSRGNMAYELCKQIKAPSPVGWNDYRGYPLEEIFDRYVPDNHGIEEIATLEYLVKMFPWHDGTELDLVKYAPQSFEKAFHELLGQVEKMKTKDAKKIAHLLAGLATAYNELYANEPSEAINFKNALFDIPIRTGWDRTTTVNGLFIKYGLIEWSEAYEVRKVEDLKKMYDLSKAEAEELHQYLLRRNEK